uniref:Sdz-33 F-box domain-containing protein n=1 Tax=Caenorhabditis brenneri TaxID=135651 RepID=B6VBP2_CAEBE|nr:hypothetical protein Cbre_JD17.001 [Caenorhabditis brenneri]
MDDFVDIFRVKSVDFDLELAGGIGLQFLEYAIRLGLKFKKVQVSIDGDNLDDNRKVLSACAQASEVHVTSYDCPESFRFESFHEYAMDYFELEVDKRCEWFTLDHLCALVNCSNVRIYYVKLSDADLNKFLKHWIARAGKMKTLVVDLAYPEDIMNIEVINAQIVMNGIPRKEIESADNGSKFEIERSNGVKAFVTCGCLSFTMELST